jgi:RNA polymerase sigma factor (sigma-70 family)
MVRVAACVDKCHDFLISVGPSGDVITTKTLAEEVMAALENEERLDERELCVRILTRLSARETTAYQKRAEAELVRVCAARRRSQREYLDRWVLRSLKAYGLNTDLSALDILADPGAKAGAAALAAAEALGYCGDGRLAEELGRAYDAAAEVVSVEAGVAKADSLGIDGERLSWAVVAREGKRHIRLVLKESNTAAKAWPDRNADSLIGYAWQGLRLALRNYDPAIGMFSTYACPRIRGTIRDGIRSEHHLPKRVLTFVRKVEREREKLEQGLGRHASLAEVAAALEFDLDKLSPLTRYATPMSYEELVSRPGAAEPSALVSLDDDPGEMAVLRARSEDVEAAMAALSEVTRRVITLSVVEGVGLEKTAKLLSMSVDSVRDAKEKGLATLAATLAAWAPVAV